MKIGIITPYDADNCGAYLQAFASKYFLESLGHEVSFIKWRNDQDRRKAFFRHGKSVKEKLLFLIQLRFRFRSLKIMTGELSKLKIVDFNNTCETQFDAIVLGSDEIWNIKSDTFKNGMFYGLNTSYMCMAYAPSASDCTLDDFTNYRNLVEALKKLKIIGVRDANTRTLINELIGYEPKLVCDPTMLLKLGQYPVMTNRIVKEKYLLVYSYTVPNVHREYIKKYAKEKGLKVIAVGLHQFWCEKNINCTPFEFINLIQNAECVYTTTFHGAIFTFLSHKKCIIYRSSKKVTDLVNWTQMNKVSCEKNVSYDEFAESIDYEPDYITFEMIVGEKRQYSIDMYKKALDEVVQ